MVSKFITISAKLFVVLVLSLLLNSIVAAQDSTTLVKLDRLTKVYRNLELNTLGFNDLKRTWILTDPVFVRAMFNRFLVNNGLRVNGKKPGHDLINSKVTEIYNGNVFIDLRKRFYDEEIEYFRFYREMDAAKGDTTDYFFDAVTDYVRLKDIIGDENYALLRQKTYAHNDITKTYYDNKLSYKFDLNISLFDPEVMFFTNTTQPDIHNKYTLSFLGRWGLDKIGLPGWASPMYVVGVKLNYIDYLTNNKPNSEYNFVVGTGLAANTPYPDKDVPTGKRLYQTGFNTYFNIEGDFLKFASPSLKNYRIGLEGILSLNTANSNEVGPNYKLDIQSIRNYLALSINRKDWVPLSSFGYFGMTIGFTLYDLSDFSLDPSDPIMIDRTKDGKVRYGSYIKFDIGKEDPLLGYMLSPAFGYNFTESSGYVGFKFNFMISNSFGFTFGYYNAINFANEAIQKYHKDNYVVFSPVIRINY